MQITELENKMKRHSEIIKATISAPFDLKTEISKMEGKSMNNNKKIIWLKKVSVIAAMITICAITVVSAGALNGWFKDIKRIDGAIVGEEYVNATNEIEVTATNIVNNDGKLLLPLKITFKNPNELPFSEFQEVAISEFKIIDSKNTEVLNFSSSVDNSPKMAIQNGESQVNLPVDSSKLKAGESYKIIINSIYGLAKANQPLKMLGNWEYQFSK